MHFLGIKMKVKSLPKGSVKKRGTGWRTGQYGSSRSAASVRSVCAGHRGGVGAEGRGFFPPDHKDTLSLSENRQEGRRQDQDERRLWGHAEVEGVELRGGGEGGTLDGKKEDSQHLGWWDPLAGQLSCPILILFPALACSL